MAVASEERRVAATTVAQTTGGRVGRRLLVLGGVLSTLNGAAHFALPVIYPWAEHVEGLYEPVRWALYATTVFFGVLLVLGGALTVAVARTSGVPTRVVTWVAGGMAAFWTVGAVYEVAIPFPDPVAGRILPAFSILVALLHVLGLRLHVLSRREPAITERDPSLSRPRV
jgi:hypothetical protein